MKIIKKLNYKNCFKAFTCLLVLILFVWLFISWFDIAFDTLETAADWKYNLIILITNFFDQFVS